MKLRIVIAVLALLFIAPTYAQYSKPVMVSQINTSFPDNTTGAITPATTRTFLNNLLNSFQQYTAVNPQTGTSYTLQVSDYGQLVTFSNVGAVAVALPQAAGSFLYWNAYLENIGTGAATITPAGGSTICGGATLVLSTNQVVHVISDGTNYQCLRSVNTSVAGLGVANSILGNPSGTAADRSDISMPSCSASGSTLQWTTNSGIGCVTAVGTFNSRSGAVSPAAGDYTLPQLYNCVLTPQGRITITTGVPVMVSTISNANTVYYTPYSGQMVPIYDGTRFICTDTGGELSQATTDNTKSPLAVATNACYDIFVWNDAGTIRATRGKVWTNVTTRADALQRINGILTNGTAVTNGPAQNRGTYVGTVCSNGSSLIDFIYGGSASGGTAANLNVWNQYNRVSIQTSVVDTGAPYAPATGPVQARGSAGNQVTIVSGNPEDGIHTAYGVSFTTGTTIGNGVSDGVGLDSTSTFYSGRPVSFFTPTTSAFTIALSGTWIIAPQTGRHVISANESSNNVSTNDSADVGSTNSLFVSFRM